HIPRPPNAFIIFRTEYIRATETQKSTPEVSKRLGDMWKGMSDEEKEPWVTRAEIAKEEHKRKYPTYKFKPI
ncbi:high mobility group box domain-containing protein, partial [Hysterangium stoloniferum]